MSYIELTNDERKVLELLGKLHISQNKNINEATIRKKLPSKYQTCMKRLKTCTAKDF
ncbi:MAG: hypothetical protein OIN89_09515 [Candidatus Methanoperedens sp.]|nr:hypothetical protein [Candidatus Methanoperedens sp.]